MDGRRAEERVVRWLRRRGHIVVARNVRTRYGEIDVVALDGETVCIVEVRSRAPGALVDPLESIDSRKRRRIERSALSFLAMRRLDERPVRFDVAAVVGSEIRYVEDAWSPTDP